MRDGEDAVVAAAVDDKDDDDADALGVVHFTVFTCAAYHRPSSGQKIAKYLP